MIVGVLGPRWRTGRFAALLLALVLVAACGDDAVAPTAEAAPLGATIARERLFEASRAFELTLRNTGDSPIQITAARLVSDLFEPVGADPRVVTVRPSGDPVSMPLGFGPAVCGGGDPAMAVALAVDGLQRELALGEAPEGIRRVHEGECATAEVLEAVDIAFSEDWRPTAEGGIAGTITLDRLGDAEVVVEEVDPASVVFTVDEETPLPTSDDLRIGVTAARCDTHALIESKKLFHLRLWVRVGGGERVRIELEAREGPARDGLERLLEECTSAQA